MSKRISILLMCCILAAVTVCAVADVQVLGAPPNDIIWPVFRYGVNRPPVKSLQYLLRARGYSVVVDGKFGKQTEAAVKRYQQAHHLKVDGAVGARTWESLVIKVRKGSHGDAVRAAQVALNWQFQHWNAPAGKKPKQIPVDGDFGAVTEKAVKFFSGSTVVDDGTWCYLVGGSPSGD
jgi:peptidoglycan hydrolase-like protein with peptidoglycan-binding domain